MIFINDLFDELYNENMRLSNQLLFANKCLTILYEFKDHFYNNYINTQTCADIKLNDLETQLNSLINSEPNDQQINESENIEAEQQNLSKRKKLKIRKVERVCSDQLRRPSELSLEQKYNIIKAMDNRGDMKKIEIAKQFNISLPNVLHIYKAKQKIINRYTGNESSREEQNNISLKLSNDIDICNNLNDENKKYRKSRRFKCDWIGCTYCGETRSQLVYHKNWHLGVRPYKCTFNSCNKAYFSEYSLRSHIHLSHVLKKSFACDWPECGLKFKTQSRLNVHKKIHLVSYDDKPFACDYTECTFRSFNKTTLNIHVMSTHSDAKLFKCTHDGCEKAFKLESTLKGHLLTHISEPHFKCDWPDCDVAYRSHFALKRHKLLKHEKVDVCRYACEWPGCDYKSDRQGRITRHKSIHSDERKYECSWPLCGLKLKTAQNLRKHLRIHMNDKRFSCEWPGCDYSAVQRYNLTQHFAKHTKK